MYREKQCIRVAKLHEKVANQRKDFLHKLSRQIANAYDCVCIEDLNMKAMSQALNFGKSVADNGWGMFTAFLQYKLEETGKQLVKVDKFFASSQFCSVCGYQNSGTKKQNRGTHGVSSLILYRLLYLNEKPPPLSEA